MTEDANIKVLDDVGSGYCSVLINIRKLQASKRSQVKPKWNFKMVDWNSYGKRKKNDAGLNSRIRSGDINTAVTKSAQLQLPENIFQW